MQAQRRVRWLSRITVGILVLAVIEALSFAGIWVSARVLDPPIRRTASIYREQSQRIRRLLTPDTLRREVLDPELGWRYRAGFRRGGDIINAQALRSTRDYDPSPLATQGMTRIAAFGDSFVYGNEVDTQDAWTSQLETMFPGVEALNYGVGGYGVDQAYLRYRAEGRAFAPHVVLIGFVSDDLRRLVNVYRRFIADYEAPLVKPRFMLDPSGTPRLLPVPLRDARDYARLAAFPKNARALGQHDQWYEPAMYENPVYDYSATVRLVTSLWVQVHNRYFDPNRLLDGDVFNTSSDAYRIQLQLFALFTQDIARDGARPLVLLFPDLVSLQAELQGRPPAFAPMKVSMEQRGIPYLDLSADFLVHARQSGVDGLFLAGGHYSPLGNAIVARAVGSALTSTAGRTDVAAPLNHGAAATASVRTSRSGA